MNSINYYIFLTATRDKLFISLAILLILNGIICSFLGQISIVEKDIITICLFSGISKYILILGLIIFHGFYFRRLFERQEINFIISKPISRLQFSIAYLQTNFLLNLVIVTFFIIIAIIIYPNSISNILLFSLSLFIEILLVTNFTQFIAICCKNYLSSIFITLFFYLLSKLAGPLLGFIENQSFSTNLNLHLEKIIITLLKIITLFIPRLDLSANSDYIIYGIKKPQIFFSLIIINIIFVIFLNILFIINFEKKEL